MDIRHQNIKFQFHKGTIRTEKEKKEEINMKPHFNSIKVQLERLLPKGIVFGTKFQFHKGTIRTYNGAFCFGLKSISIP